MSTAGMITGFDVLVVGAPWRELTFVEVHTDQGLHGVGEVRMVSKTDTLLAAIAELGERYVVGTDPFQLSRLAWQVQVGEYGKPGEITQSALAAFDVACWDLMGQALGVPVWKLLGGRFRDAVPAYANGWYRTGRDPVAVAERAREVVAGGYRALKIDPFGAAVATLTAAELRRSVAILEAVRDAVGPDVELYLEMHGRFTAATARLVAAAVAPTRPGWLEEPVPPGDLQGLRSVRAHTSLPIATGERIHTADELVPYLEGGLVDILQVDLTHFGGITGLHRLAGWTGAYNIQLAPHNVCGPVGTAAAVHFAVATANVAVLEHFNDFADPWVFDLAAGAPRVDPATGSFPVPQAPGLGVRLDRDACAAYPRSFGRLPLFSEGWERRAEYRSPGPAVLAPAPQVESAGPDTGAG
ncbi:MAG TPA: mandelate racemase/muconate lactonizing enzyme family protein [Micromonosporaceae bacterium]|nr:mandelate racemase/muconate lactonizing enzyme family protein [Micromonosporaceae bacterium]